MKHRSGTPRFCEWDRLWKASATSSDVTRDEYEAVFQEFDAYCRKMFARFPRYPVDFYIRGDFAGDRTQVLEVNNPQILTTDFLKEIQHRLLQAEHTDWRIVIPTHLTKREVIVLYPRTVRISPRHEKCLEKALESISARMKSYVD